MEENKSFSDALSYLKSGGTVALPKWSADVYISMQRPDAHSKMTHPYLYVTSRFGMVPWMPTQVELLSEEWILI